MKSPYLRALHVFHLLRRPMTLGVRAAAFDARGHVFLVRHTYLKGWHLPGGGVDAGETVEAAVRRELEEEGNLAFASRPRLVSVHFNDAGSRRDHVLFFRADAVRQTAERRPDREIAECGFFPPDALPEGTTPATACRLRELDGREAPDPSW